jgi:hypothetical protein
MSILKNNYINKDFIKRSNDLASNITLKLARSIDDWTKLQHNFERHYPHGDCFPVIYASPQTYVLSAYQEGKLVGSISLFHSGAFPLPLEESISINAISSPKHRSLEATDLVISEDFSLKSELALILLRYSLHFVETGLPVNRIILTDVYNVHGNLLDEIGFGCLNKNFPKEYAFRKGSKACFYYGNFSSIYHKLSSSTDKDKVALANFLSSARNTKSELRDFIYQRASCNQLSKEAFNFILPYSKLAELTQEELRALSNSYLHSPEILCFIPKTNLPNFRKEVRHPVECDAIVLDEKNQPLNANPVTVVSVAKGGLGFFSEDCKWKKGSLVKLRVELGHNIMSDIEIKVGSSYQGMVTGKVINKDHYWSRYHQFLNKRTAAANI